MFEELLLGVGLSSAFVAGVMARRASGQRGFARIPVLTLACSTVVAAFSFAQLIVAPDLLPLLMRESSRVASGEVWRLATSLLVQDGGWAGVMFNLVGLLGIGTVAESMLGRSRWAAVAVFSVAAAQLFALRWQPTGAGNSILNFGLAGAVCAVCMTTQPPKHALAPAVVASACFVALLATRNLHGVAGVAGIFVEVALVRFVRKQ